ncbi:MAG: polyprenyl synthetase family protein [Ruminococcus sp.]|nr:polyprenyl synthetase family protein [Ruminococcus sp.]
MTKVLAETKGQRKVAEAMGYSLSAGGKRIRPVLAAEFCRICGGDAEAALPAACALEMIHTFSLIHDDLPCMDDDDMRRGKPSCHAAFGEAMALLAGDALLNYAYEVISGGDGLSAETKLALISELSKATGVNGMIGGQVIDTTFEGKMTEAELLNMYSMKTGALLKTACKMGCIAAGAGDEKIAAAELYAEKLGLAFQIIDDILDVTGDEKLLGKPIGSDSENDKTTYVTLNGTEKSRNAAEILTDEALNALEAFEDTQFLKELTLFLLKRDH